MMLPVGVVIEKEEEMEPGLADWVWMLMICWFGAWE